MKRIIPILLLSYYMMGVLILPNGNFSAMTNLPDMYRNCKATEDADMGPFDFIKDHLINIDRIFDAHNHGDEQKPHHPVAFNDNHVQALFLPLEFELDLSRFFFSESIFLQGSKDDYFYTYSGDIFRPPILII